MATKKTIWVVWGNEGVPCPKLRTRRVVDRRTGVDRTMIYGEPVEVPYKRYYRRRIAKGDLKHVEAPTAKPLKAKRTTAPAVLED